MFSSRHWDGAAVAGVRRGPAKQDGGRPACLQGPRGKTGSASCEFDPIRVPASVPQHRAAAEEDIWEGSQFEGNVIKYGRSLFKTNPDRLQVDKHVRILRTGRVGAAGAVRHPTGAAREAGGKQ